MELYCLFLSFFSFSHFFKLQSAIGWISSISILLYVLFGLHDTQLTSIKAAAYSSLSHTAWAIGLGWLVIACATGNGGFVNKFLSSTCWFSWSRVTYCAYLINPLIVKMFIFTKESPQQIGVIFLVKFSL
jgi:hypothetical protein